MRFTTVLIFLFLLATPSYAQNTTLKTELINAVAQFNMTGDNFENSNLASVFEKLAQSTPAKKEWISSYYLSLIYARLSAKNKKFADENADKAVYWAKKSIEIEDNDENECALSMAYTMKMAVNPFLRWVSYEKNIYDPLNKAKKLNPTNPRIYIMEGSLSLNLPKLFGGGCNKAKPILLKAKQLLDKQTPQQVLPTWGKNHLEKLSATCPF